MTTTNDLPKSLAPELLSIADTKWVLGHWYIKLMRNGRNLPDFNAFAGMSQDELGHTRAIFRFLEDSMGQPENYLEFGRAADRIHSMEVLDQAPVNWGDFACTVFLVEGALWSVMRSFIDSSFVPVRNMVEQFGQESNFHRLYITGWLKALSEDDRADLVQALRVRLPMITAWFHGDPASDAALTASGVKNASLDAARAYFIEEVVPALCAHAGLDAAPDVGKAPTENWDPVRRRPLGSTMPAELWEFVMPTNEQAVLARRKLEVSSEDNLEFVSPERKPSEELRA